MNINFQKPLEKYSWLSKTTTVEEYIAPEYYNRLLKEYVFDEKTDLKYLEDYLSQLSPDLAALELGCGTGRATDVAIQSGKCRTLTLVDLSRQMLQSSIQRFHHVTGLEYFHADSLDYINSTAHQYDLIFSLWSYSHSAHQLLHKLGEERGASQLKSILNRLLREVMKEDGRFFLIHFDSQSDEQRILMRQWAKVYPVFKKVNMQSPSKIILDQVLDDLKQQKIVEVEIKHMIGKPIIYRNIEEALEIFMNFHLECFFNTECYVENILKEISDDMSQFADVNGVLSIKPGCFIYSIKRL